MLFSGVHIYDRQVTSSTRCPQATHSCWRPQGGQSPDEELNKTQLQTLPRVSSHDITTVSGQRVTAAKFYKFPSIQWRLPRRRVSTRRGSSNRPGEPPRGSARRLPGRAKERGVLEEGVVYLGRRQEVGPEGGSGRLEGEHDAAAFSPPPGRNPGPAAGRR